MAQGWTGSEIVTKYRALTGLKSTDQRSDALCLDDCNDYYQNHFPIESSLERFEADFEQAMAVNDDGNYAISAEYLVLKPPYTIDNFPARLFADKDSFDAAYQKETNPVNLTDPTLVIGSSSTTAVANSAFSYRIGSYSYPKAAAETELSGDTIPQNMYGAYRLEIDSDGTISIVEAANDTGYSSAGRAVQALQAESGDNCCMGYLTVISTDSGGFVPGTTALDDSALTVTYTDGYHSNRGTPNGVCIDRRRLWVGPKPDDIHVFKGTAILRPDALTTATAPLDIAWGIVIAYGAAVIRKSEKDDEGVLEQLLQAKEYFMNMIRRPDLLQKSNTRSKPRW